VSIAASTHAFPRSVSVTSLARDVGVERGPAGGGGGVAGGASFAAQGHGGLGVAGVDEHGEVGAEVAVAEAQRGA